LSDEGKAGFLLQRDETHGQIEGLVQVFSPRKSRKLPPRR
jgi:hypothetical protein